MFYRVSVKPVEGADDKGMHAPPRRPKESLVVLADGLCVRAAAEGIPDQRLWDKNLD